MQKRLCIDISLHSLLTDTNLNLISFAVRIQTRTKEVPTLCLPTSNQLKITGIICDRLFKKMSLSILTTRSSPTPAKAKQRSKQHRRLELDQTWSWFSTLKKSRRNVDSVLWRSYSTTSPTTKAKVWRRRFAMLEALSRSTFLTFLIRSFDIVIDVALKRIWSFSAWSLLLPISLTKITFRNGFARKTWWESFSSFAAQTSPGTIWVKKIARKSTRSWQNVQERDPWPGKYCYNTVEPALWDHFGTESKWLH